MLPPLLSRILAVLLAVGCLLILWVIVFSKAFSGIAAEGVSYKQNLERIMRYQSLRNEKDLIEKAVVDMQRESLPVYKGENVSMMVASLQRDVSSLVSSSGAMLNSARPDGNGRQVKGDFQRLAVQISITCTVVQLSKFLDSLRDFSQLIVVDKASIRVLDSGVSGGAPRLSANVSVVAYGDVLL